MDNPKAFFCHSSKDSGLVKEIATTLLSNGIETWVDDWDILIGDSIRRNIEKGIQDCDFFLIMLTPDSLESEWVHTELDMATIERIQGKCEIIPIIRDLVVEDIPLSLRAIKGVLFKDKTSCISKLVSACLGLNDKPGVAEARSVDTSTDFDLSPMAIAVAKFLNLASDHGVTYFPPLYFRDDIANELHYQIDDIAEAVDELEERGWLTLSPNFNFSPRVNMENWFFWETDPVFRGWAPANDAVEIAGILSHNKESVTSSEKLCEILRWGYRRFNPAAT